MKRFRYDTPGPNGKNIITIITEQEIIDTYYEYWSKKMKEVGKEEEISKEHR